MGNLALTFIGPLAAALLAYAAVSGPDAEWRWGAPMLAAGVALTSHGAKATTRAAVNTSPEPLSNWTLSLGEDVMAVLVSWGGRVCRLEERWGGGEGRSPGVAQYLKKKT